MNDYISGLQTFLNNWQRNFGEIPKKIVVSKKLHHQLVTALSQNYTPLVEDKHPRVLKYYHGSDWVQIEQE